MDSLSAAPHLREFRGQCTRISSLDALRECHRLELLDVGGCQQVHCIEALRGAKAPRYLDISNTSVANIDALSQCTALERVNLNGCLRLCSLGWSLAFCTELRELHASRTCIETLIGLRLCRVLSKVNVSGCSALRGTAALAHLSQLTHLNLSFTAVNDVSSLGYYSGLEKLRMHGCTRLSDISALQSARRLRVVDLDNTRCTERVAAAVGTAPELEELLTNGVTYWTAVSILRPAGAQRDRSLPNTDGSSR
ncbi:adenylate_cyclase_regulatory_protein-like_protein (plasmid) [Leishmania braziliensis MHOM/BR/75/M2904]|uniref:Adenylate_cyclase_regulatory_protein-like_protein n=1 Tax=Leishmania braziliensis MHOM/BR/75/M2904 TaxID=420245 RepID=A0A3P3YXZ5_LEIBR|nr:adenylate_cyclase_regulatory_protein-like_protein [Leishmania braziliensis MHOM/BR/75/M2904]